MTDSGSTIGFLGLGRMGAPMAANLVGHVGTLVVHDLYPPAVGAPMRPSPRNPIVLPESVIASAR